MFYFSWVVCHECNGFDFEVGEHECGDTVLSSIVWKMECTIGLDGIQSCFLCSIDSDFVGKTDSTSFLLKIDNDTFVVSKRTFCR